MKPELRQPWHLVEDFHRRANQMLDELLQKISTSHDEESPLSFVPNLDLVESDNEFRIYISVPGLVEDDIEIQVDHRSVTICGERRAPYDLDQRGPRMREWRYGCFERYLELPHPIDPTDIRAVYDSGVLTIVAPKTKQEDR